jgi:hypothetical protein
MTSRNPILDGPNPNYQSPVVWGHTPAHHVRRHPDRYDPYAIPPWKKHLWGYLEDTTSKAFRLAYDVGVILPKVAHGYGVGELMERKKFEDDMTEFGRKQEEAFNAYSGKITHAGNYTEGGYNNTFFDKPSGGNPPPTRNSRQENGRSAAPTSAAGAVAAIIAADLGRRRSIQISQQKRKKKPKTKNEVIRFYRECRVPWTTIVRIIRAMGWLKRRRRYTTGTE